MDKLSNEELVDEHNHRYATMGKHIETERELISRLTRGRKAIELVGLIIAERKEHKHNFLDWLDKKLGDYQQSEQKEGEG